VFIFLTATHQGQLQAFNLGTSSITNSDQVGFIQSVVVDSLKVMTFGIIF
jgi:hypothetical protein